MRKHCGSPENCVKTNGSPSTARAEAGSVRRENVKTKSAAETLKRLGVTGKAVLIDVTLDDKLAKSVRNIPGVAMVPSSRVTARDVMNAGRVVVTRGALEKLQEALG